MFALRFAPLLLLATSFVSGIAVVEKRATTADVQSCAIQFYPFYICSCTRSFSGIWGTATDTTITPLISELTAALNTATASLAALGPVSSTKRQSEDDIANSVAGLVIEITQALDILLLDAAFDVKILLAGVDVALHKLLLGLDGVLIGVVSLVAHLLVGVAGVLESLGFTLTIALLGLGL
ncbi:hypothetical protein B0H12DRAFT_1162815 [Mycena haematopus]|nr:hypothetical protein B0H12DRAFT_1162815 [Mycena haematopus]